MEVTASDSGRRIKTRKTEIGKGEDLVDLKQIEYILKIAEMKNVSQASKELFISQSALNQQLLKLEKELGAPLFFRDRNNWELTPTGELYVKGAREILQIKKNTYNQIEDELGTARRAFSLGLAAGRGIRMFASIYPQFMERCPQTSISPIEIGTYEQQELIEAGRLDLGFLTIGPGKRANLKYIHVCSEDLLAALPEKHPLAMEAAAKGAGKYSELDLKLLKDENFVLMFPKSSCRAVTDQAFREAGFEPKILFETSSAASVPSFVAAGICCAIIPRYYARDQKGIALFYLKSRPRWEMDFCYSRRSYLSRPLQTFIQMSGEYWRTYYGADES